MQLTQSQAGLYVIGDEILLGKRRDRHQTFFRDLLAEFGWKLSWVSYLPDDPALLVARFRASMNENIPVFSCGGIGATPDDVTRQCAAKAAEVAFARHPEAKTILEEKFGNEAYPNRILMADLPVGCGLIPNPYNRVPGFFIKQHFFLPGFPDMAHPMGRWVVEQYFQPALAEHEASIRIFGAMESDLMPMMQALTCAYTSLKLFSLPRIGEQRFIELGFRGKEDLSHAMEDLISRVEKAGLDYKTSSEFS